MVLQPRGFLSIGEAERFGTVFDRLSDKQMGRAPHLSSDLAPGFVSGVESQKRFSGQRPQLESSRLCKNHFSLVQISQPVGLDSRQNGRFTEIEPDHRVRKMKQAPVVCEL